MKKQKPDDYFNNGMFEIACFGRSTFMKNIMSEAENERYRNKLKAEFPKMKQDINDLIASIRERVCRCNPVKLLTFASDRFLVSMLNVKSEVQYPIEAINSSRMTEYVQSILVSSPNYYDFSKEYTTDITKEFLSIQAEIEKLYQLINSFYLSWGLKLIEDHPEWDRSTIDTAVLSQMLFLVRGQRYPIVETEYHSRLLKIHNEEFIKIFKLNAEDILDGFKKLQYALSEGKLNSCKEFDKIFDEMEQTENLDMDQFFKSHTTQTQDFIEKFFGVKLRDVIEVTGWTEEFVAALSYGINEDTNFFNQSDYAEWSIIDLPVQKRPFIKIGEQYLCFDYYTFVDNFYRVIQKSISRFDPTYVWSEKQNEASETMVENVFKQILPGSVTYRNNYYKIGKSKNDYAENDLLIIYSGVMFIVEIKAGSFIYTAPLTDFEHHINSYKTLLEAPDNQCKRTYDYLASKNKADIFDKDHNLKTTIDMTEVNDIYMFSVTIDNINDFAAHAEKLSFLNLKCNAISISIDDLMIYREYFDSPLEFLHFLKQRRYATQEPKLILNDELDHLGMYIEHNCYHLIMRNFDNDTHNTFYGYREKLDEYFSSLMHPELAPQKPLQNRSELFQQILLYLDNSNIKNKVELSDYILSFNADAEEKFNKNVLYILKRQAEINHMIPTSSGGQNDDLRYTCFIRQPNIDRISNKEKRDYVLSSLLWNDDKDRVMLELDFDEDNKFKCISMKMFTVEDVVDNERDYLYELGKQKADRLVEKYKSENKKKIGRNDLCPCGSGKKYKRCCGKV